jgi:hypothetical protein
MARRAALVGLLVALVLGCGGDNYDIVPTGDHDPIGVVPPDVVPVAPVVPAPVAPAPSDVAVAIDPKVVDAYVDSCLHVFPANIDPQFSENDPSNECTWREFDQNCAPDQFGCWTKGETCRDACHKPCTDCQATCSGACDGCKAQCHDDACVRKCAEDRARCRNTCMTAHEGCTTGPTCANLEQACDAEAEKQKAAKCPDCANIEECITEGWNRTGADPTESCKVKFPGNAEECWSWCGFMQ